MISNCLKLLVPVCLTIALCGCQQPITRQEMVGTYRYMGKVDGGLLILRQNGTYMEEYEGGASQGQWKIYVDDKIIMDDTRLSLLNSAKSSIWDTLVERDGEDILIITDIDTAHLYKKMRH